MYDYIDEHALYVYVYFLVHVLNLINSLPVLFKRRIGIVLNSKRSVADIEKWETNVLYLKVFCFKI